MPAILARVPEWLGRPGTHPVPLPTMFQLVKSAPKRHVSLALLNITHHLSVKGKQPQVLDLWVTRHRKQQDKLNSYASMRFGSARS